MQKQIDDEYLAGYLSEKYRLAKIRKLSAYLNTGVTVFGESETALKYAAFMFEIEQRKNQDTFNNKKLTDVITRGLKGERVSLVSMLCCINKYDYQGGFGLEADLFAYLKNPKLEPIPLIIDELLAAQEMFAFYGVETDLAIYISDTEYTQVGKFGIPTPALLDSLERYLKNLRNYVLPKEKRVRVEKISAITDGNSKYDKTRSEIYAKVRRWNDSDFNTKWYQKFERYFERIYDSQCKRKVFPTNQARQLSLEITRNRWAVNAAEGIVFSGLGENTVLISTETRERDLNYTLASSPSSLPPMIYILKAAEMWSRKQLVKDNPDD